jgi:UDP-N-acetyl-D-glucosamine/UDP-N-acetyl-D-galactosamine dehydrogenase
MIKICVVGLGYVGLPLALELSKHFETFGFDVNEERINTLIAGQDYSNDIGEEKIKLSKLRFTLNPKKINESNFIIVCVPTPIDATNNPDLGLIKLASVMVGKNLSEGSTVVYESTVYPGVTEEICLPILEKESGLKHGINFKVGYSPERINPGDKEHTLNQIVKVVSGSDKESLELIDQVYNKITKTHRAQNIKVAEAAKVIENIQRDLNIALMNELAIIFDKMGINTKHVLDAAGTKWNFHKYSPGLVGGHCIGVDPYYLTYKSGQLGYHPEVILAGRRINDNMHKFFAEKIIKQLISKKKQIKDARILVMGLTFKPNVKDYRNSRVKNFIHELKEYGLDVAAFDPMLDSNLIEKEFGVRYCDVRQAKNIDYFVLAVNHDLLSEEVKKINPEILFIIE